MSEDPGKAYRKAHDEAIREAESAAPPDPRQWAEWLIACAPVVCSLRSKKAPQAGLVDCPVCGAPSSLHFQVDAHRRVQSLACETKGCVQSSLLPAGTEKPRGD